MATLNVFRAAKLTGVLIGSVGLLAGIVYSFGGLLIDGLVSAGLMTSSETPGLSSGTLLAFGALIGMPLIGAVVGFVAGLVGALVYNVLVKFGIDLRIE